MQKRKVIVQGFPGCFHEEAARKYFGSEELEIYPARTFNDLAQELLDHPMDRIAIIAIENSIAGSLLQNYRIVRENHMRVVGEVYLRIKHNLMLLPGQNISDITEVHSHPMALNQCLDFLKNYPHMKLIESEDTALSAKHIRDNEIKGRAAIASETAAEIYNLDIAASGIETSHVNYTRFFITQDASRPLMLTDFNKASIYVRVRHEKGSLMRVLQAVSDNNINLSKLQSYPVLGEVNAYYFHLDLEFEDLDDYELLIEELQNLTLMLEVIGVYKKATIYDHSTIA